VAFSDGRPKMLIERKCADAEPSLSAHRIALRYWQALEGEAVDEYETEGAFRG